MVTERGAIMDLIVEDGGKKASIRFLPEGGTPKILKLTNGSTTSFVAMVSAAGASLFHEPGPIRANVHLTYDIGENEVDEIRITR